MKTLFQMLLMFTVVGFMTACGGPEGQKVEAGAAKEEAKAATTAKAYTIDAGASQVNWVGAKPTGTHMGTLQISGGNLAVVNGNITAGEFTLDMGSITVTDLAAGEGKEKLEGHLKTGDFFEVEQHPKGTFAITSVKPAQGIEDATHEITGNLTMKGITKSVTLPANVNITDSKITAVTPSFTIDRTEWDIVYKSGSLADTAKDKVINDEIGLVINLAANAGAAM
ncbi:MAG: YceI family protein [Saprospiraceae bacterium]